MWLEGSDYARRWRLTEMDKGVRYLVPLGTAQLLLKRGWIADVYQDRYGAHQYRLTDVGRSVLSTLKAKDFEGPPRVGPKMTEAFIVEALARRHPGPASFFHANFEVGNGSIGGSRVDGLAMELYASGGYIVTAYEIKVSRGDFKREMKAARKNRFIRECADEFVFVCPQGLIREDEVGPTDGLLYVRPDGSTRIQKRPLRILGPDGKKPLLARPMVAAMLKKRGRMERQALRVAFWMGRFLEGVAKRGKVELWEGEKNLLREQKYMHEMALRLGIINKDGDV
jgi:hypothetical protein